MGRNLTYGTICRQGRLGMELPTLSPRACPATCPPLNCTTATYCLHHPLVATMVSYEYFQLTGITHRIFPAIRPNFQTDGCAAINRQPPRGVLGLPVQLVVGLDYQCNLWWAWIPQCAAHSVYCGVLVLLCACIVVCLDCGVLVLCTLW